MQAKTIPVTIHLIRLQRFTEQVDPSTPISSLTPKYPNLDFYHNAQKLALDKTFEQCGILAGQSIHTYSSDRPMYMMEMFFKFQDQSVVSMNLPHIMPFGCVMDRLAEMKGWPKEAVRLVFAGRLLQRDMAFMDESGMQKETTLHVVCKNQ